MNMDDESYGGASSGAPNTAEPGEAPDNEKDGGNTALIPKTLFGGDCKVGDTYTVKVVGVLEDELEVEPVKEGSEDSGGESGKSRFAMAGEKLDSMG